LPDSDADRDRHPGPGNPHPEMDPDPHPEIDPVNYVFPQKLNMLSKIIKIMTPIALIRKIKQFKLALLWIKVEKFSYFQLVYNLRKDLDLDLNRHQIMERRIRIRIRIGIMKEYLNRKKELETIQREEIKGQKSSINKKKRKKPN
jgi:hypothetical protein